MCEEGKETNFHKKLHEKFTPGFLKCMSCKNLFSLDDDGNGLPIILPCGHTYCGNCFQEYTKNEQRDLIQCFKVSFPSEIQQKDIRPVTHKALVEELEKIKELQLSSVTISENSVCDTRCYCADQLEVHFLCLTCNEYICKKCCTSWHQGHGFRLLCDEFIKRFDELKAFCDTLDHELEDKTEFHIQQVLERELFLFFDKYEKNLETAEEILSNQVKNMDVTEYISLFAAAYEETVLAIQQTLSDTSLICESAILYHEVLEEVAKQITSTAIPQVIARALPVGNDEKSDEFYDCWYITSPSFTTIRASEKLSESAVNNFVKAKFRELVIE